jgi:hypothetical protein
MAMVKGIVHFLIRRVLLISISALPAYYSHFRARCQQLEVTKLLKFLVPHPEMPATCSYKLLTCLVVPPPIKRKEAGVDVM